LDWLRRQTPEPFGTEAAWNDYHPALPEGTEFGYPPGVYSVLVWWDFGYWVEYLGRRIPTSNGTQAGARDTAAFYTDGDPDSALRELDRLGARYVLLEPLLSVEGTSSRLPAILNWAERPLADYMRIYVY